ncbi:hypothetical protein [Arenimonas sp.]|uniref:hypothetical protein n=1 Tax=Arenimonas sp. TaxID=1872635 RepID=UPI0025CEAC54|nr:hypothetical protein [Arenimonas sp.]
MRLFLYLSLAVFTFLAAGNSHAASDDDVHVVAARVLIDGKEVMAPNVQLLADRTGYISRIDDDKNPLYSIELELTTQLEIGPVKGTGLRARVWGGKFETGSELMNATLILSPRPDDTGNVISATQTDSTGRSIEVQVSSYAVMKADPSRTAERTTRCLDEDGLIAAGDDSEAGATGCCGGLCSPPGSGSYQCCNVYACCVCGQCCIVE